MTAPISPRPLRRAHRGRWLLLGIALLVVGTESVATVRRRTRFDPGLPAEAREALDEARRSAGSSWAGAALASAEETYWQGMAGLRREKARVFFLRDMRSVSEVLAKATSQAREATAVGDRNRNEARNRAQRSLSQLSDILETLHELETRATLPREGRAGLTAARMGFVEASALLEAGTYLEAEIRSREALTLASAATETLGKAFLRFADQESIADWRGWIAETIEWSRVHGAVALVVIKEKNLLEVYRGGRKIRSIPADMGSNSLAQKYRQGDRATPEGRYRVRQVKDRGESRYYRAFLLDYPTPEDVRRIRAAKEAGTIPPGAGPGGLIEIHGEGGRGKDWTNGCVAVTNPEMDELFALVQVGTPVTIVGGDGSNGTFSSLAEVLRREP